MIFTKKHFPFLLLLTFLFSCNKEKKESKGIDLYTKHIDKASEKATINEHDSAFYYYNKAKLVCTKEDDQYVVYTLLKMGELQNNIADYSGLEASMTEALEVTKSPTNYYLNIYNLLGIAYQGQFDYDMAISYYNKSLKLTTNEYDKALIKNNIAFIYMSKGDYTKAIKILEPLTKIDTLYKNKEGYAKIIDNLGYSYYKTNHSQALEKLKLSLSIRDSLNIDYEKIASLLHLAEFYHKSNPKLALDYSKKGYTAASTVNSPDDRILSLDYIIKNSTGDADKKYYLIYSSLSDSIKKVRNIAKNQFAKIKYDSKKITLENEKNKKLKIALLILSLTLVLGFIVYYFINKFRNKRKLQAATYETETRISKKLHDELANDVYNAITYAETQDLNDEFKKENLLESLDQIYLRTRNISKENSTIETGDDYEYHLKKMLSSYKTSNINVIISNSQTIDWNKIKKEHKIAVYRVLQELMVNMKKTQPKQSCFNWV